LRRTIGVGDQKDYQEDDREKERSSRDSFISSEHLKGRGYCKDGPKVELVRCEVGSSGAGNTMLSLEGRVAMFRRGGDVARLELTLAH
jgi:hypothetical protein